MHADDDSMQKVTDTGVVDLDRQCSKISPVATLT